MEQGNQNSELKSLPKKQTDKVEKNNYAY